MSHFTVLVIGKDVEAQLAPFHEFECTGHVDEYVKDVDITEDAKASYARATNRYKRSPTGELVDAYDVRFYRDPTPEESKEIGVLAGFGGNGKLSWDSRNWGDGLGYRTKIHYTPENWEDVVLPASETESFSEWAKGYYGYNTITLTPGAVVPQEFFELKEYKYGWVEVNEQGEVIRVIDRTNPNAKWDWYQIGGRWTGFFQLKSGGKGSLGEPSLVAMMDKNYEAPDSISGKADSARKGDIDVEAMRNESEAKATLEYDKFHGIVGNTEFETWTIIRERYKDNIDEARRVYREQKVFELLKVAQYTAWNIDPFFVRQEVYIQNARDAALPTFAVIKDGKWYERGEMGWWATVSNKKEKDEWYRQFNELFDSIPDDEWVTVVDCHI